MKKILMWMVRFFSLTIYQSHARFLGLKYYGSLAGDLSILVRAGSIWVDGKGRQYRVEQYGYEFRPFIRLNGFDVKLKY